MTREDKDYAAMVVALVILFAIFCVSAWFIGNT